MCKMSFVFGNTRENGLWLSLHQLWELAWFSSGSVQPHVELWSLIVQTRTIFQRLTFNFHLRGGRTGTLYSGFSQEEICWKESKTDLSTEGICCRHEQRNFNLKCSNFCRLAELRPVLEWTVFPKTTPSIWPGESLGPGRRNCQNQTEFLSIDVKYKYKLSVKRQVG